MIFHGLKLWVQVSFVWSQITIDAIDRVTDREIDRLKGIVIPCVVLKGVRVYPYPRVWVGYG